MSTPELDFRFEANISRPAGLTTDPAGGFVGFRIGTPQTPYPVAMVVVRSHVDGGRSKALHRAAKGIKESLQAMRILFDTTTTLQT